MTYEGSTVTFDKSDRVSTQNYFDTYLKQSGGVTDQLVVYANLRGRGPLTTAPITLSYTSFGYWTHIDSSTNSTRQTYLIFGSPTDTLPLTGTATYKTLVTADALTFTGSSSPEMAMSGVNGTATFDVDFISGSVSTLLNLQRNSDSFSYGSFNGTGKVYGVNQFMGTYTSAAPHYVSGAFLGGFYGPNAGEMGYTFNIYFHDDGLGGASVRPPTNTYINGVVVGAK